MTRQNPDIIDFYNRQIIPQIEEKYGYTFMQAVNEFVNSKTHKYVGMRKSYGQTAEFNLHQG